MADKSIQLILGALSQAVANAEGSYYRYMKAWLATRERK